MKIDYAYRKVLMLESVEDGTLNLDTVKEHFPIAVEGNEINYQKVVPLLVEAIKELQETFDNLSNVISLQQQQIEEIRDARSNR